jgi:hypothetical protein
MSRMRGAFWAVACVLLASIAWFVMRSSARTGAPAAARTETATAAEARTEVALAGESAPAGSRSEPPPPAAAAPSTSAPTSARLCVRSAVALPLAFAELELADAKWQALELDHGCCKWPDEIALPRRIRAPGHAPALVSTQSGEIVLEPDALLVLAAPELRTCTSVIRVHDPFSKELEKPRADLDRACVSGFRSDNEWLVAVSHDLITAALMKPDLVVALLWRDHRRADVHFDVVAGARARWDVPCNDIAPTAPLRVRIERTADQRAGEVTLKLVQAEAASREMHEARFDEGRVVFYPRDSAWIDPMRIAAGSSELELASLPTGMRFVLAARDMATSAYGRIEFVHDGSARIVKLGAAFVLSGRLVADDGGSPVTKVDLSWSFRDERARIPNWHGWRRDLDLDPSGSFETRGPEHELVARDALLEPPSQLVLNVAALGFEQLERTFDTGGARSFDCGALRLIRLPPALTLAPGHGLAATSLDWMGFVASAQPDMVWAVRRGEITNDGAMRVYLLEDQLGEREQRRFSGSSWIEGASVALPWTAGGSSAILLAVGGETEGPHGFELDAQGEYVGVAHREWSIDVEVHAPPDGSGSWTVGLEWRGMLHGFGQFRETRSLRFFGPSAGARLWWVTADTRPTSDLVGVASQELVEGLSSVVIR